MELSNFELFCVLIHFVCWRFIFYCFVSLYMCVCMCLCCVQRNKFNSNNYSFHFEMIAWFNSGNLFKFVCILFEFYAVPFDFTPWSIHVGFAKPHKQCNERHLTRSQSTRGYVKMGENGWRFKTIMHVVLLTCCRSYAIAIVPTSFGRFFCEKKSVLRCDTLVLCGACVWVCVVGV